MLWRCFLGLAGLVSLNAYSTSIDVPLSPDIKDLWGMEILFDPGSEKMTNPNKKLNRVVEVLKNQPTLIIQIEGHVDPKHPKFLEKSDRALDLGFIRAQMVRRELVNRGIEPERLQVISYGFERPRVVQKMADSRNDHCSINILSI